ncbi:glycosyltransferase family 25 protein [Mesorhizobium sp. B2-3-4]|nr:glycosyltransferase family 25 protein [Mesorhizobium sp. B2-3-4]
MRCLVINLDRAPGRLAHMTAEFARIQIKFERVSAVDGMSRPEIAAMSHILSPTEIACFLSHKACWHIIAEGVDAYGAVFEDDTVFTAKAGPLLADVRWIPADANIIKLETVFRKAVIGMMPSPVGFSFSLARLYGVHLGAGAYIISKKAARDLLQATGDFNIPVDHVLFDPTVATSSSKTIYQILPAACAQGLFLKDKSIELASQIEPDRLPYQMRRNLVQRRRKTPLTNVKTEARRIGLQIANVCKLRLEKTIPFHHHGARIQRGMNWMEYPTHRPAPLNANTNLDVPSNR